MTPRILALLAAVLLIVGVAACGDDDSSGDGGVPDKVASIGDEEVSGDELEEQVEAVERTYDRPEPKPPKFKSAKKLAAWQAANPKLPEPTEDQLRQQAMSELLMTKWIEYEAERRDIEVDRDQLEKEFDATSASQFKTEQDVRNFYGSRTKDDILAGLVRQEAYQQISDQVRKELGLKEGDSKGAMRVSRKLDESRERWARTVACVDGYDDSIYCSPQEKAKPAEEGDFGGK